MVNKSEFERRLSVVEERIGQFGWSLATKRMIAAELGVSGTTVDNYRRKLIELLKEELTGQDWGDRRSEFVGRLRGHQKIALLSGKYGPLAAMLNLEAKICGVEREERAQDSVGQMGPGELIDKLAGSLTIEHLDQIRARMEGRGE